MRSPKPITSVSQRTCRESEGFAAPLSDLQCRRIPFSGVSARQRTMRIPGNADTGPADHHPPTMNINPLTIAAEVPVDLDLEVVGFRRTNASGNCFLPPLPG